MSYRGYREKKLPTETIQSIAKVWTITHMHRSQSTKVNRCQTRYALYKFTFYLHYLFTD